MAYRPLTPYDENRPMATVRNEAYEMQSILSPPNDAHHVANESYRPLSPYHESPPVCIVQGEAHETQATLSPPNDAHSVADESYRPLTSSEETLSRASSRSGAIRSGEMRYGRIKRKPISPTPQQDATADEHELGNPAQHTSGEALKHDKALGNFQAKYWRATLDTWFYEGAALAFSVGCLVALAVMLSICKGQETPRLPYNITLNALVSILATAAKSSLLFAVAGTLGQVKWAWFTDRRELADMQVFDDATRGPWGAIVLLCSRSIRPLASLGAAITILALAYDPFLQQLVRYPMVPNNVPSNEATTKQANSLDATSNFTRWESARAASSLELDQFDRTPTCSTGNCTWPQFTSLGYCSKCGDTTAETSSDCSSVVGSWNGTGDLTCEIFPEQGYPATVWQGRNVPNMRQIQLQTYDSAGSIVWKVHETTGWASNDAVVDPNRTRDLKPNSSFQSGYSFLGVESPMFVFAYAVFEQESIETSDNRTDLGLLHTIDIPVLIKAETCVITPCKRTYELSMEAGKVKTVVVDTDYGVSEVLGRPYYTYDGERCWRTSDYRGTADPLPNESCVPEDSRTVNGCYQGQATSGHIFCNSMGARYGTNVTDTIGLLGRQRGSYYDNYHDLDYDTSDSEKVVTGMEFGFPMKADTGQTIKANNFSYLMERIAAAMTQAELDNSTTLILGNMTTLVVHVDVAWYWFILPATLNVVAILLLLATAVLSHRRKTQLWKSSTLALLYHGFEDSESDPDRVPAKGSEMQQQASSTSATLGLARNGCRVVLKTAPRQQTP
jgi:hypothetical protein